MFLLLLTAIGLDSESGLKPGVEPGVKPGSGFLGREIEGSRSDPSPDRVPELDKRKNFQSAIQPCFG